MVIEKKFVDNWLASWTGNRPDILLEFYTQDAFYLDPVNPKGISGKQQLLSYFKKLLQKNPNWKWAEEEIFLTEKGFTIKWRAEIPVAQENLIIYGLDIVEMTGNKISRNEVYFDRYYGFLFALSFGILLSVFFTLGYSNLSGYMINGLFLLALFFPIYRAECLLGFVIGMTFTFGAVLPTGVGTILALIGGVLYLYVRTGIIFIVKKIMPLVPPNKDNIKK